MRLFATYTLRVLMPESYRVAHEDETTRTVANLPEREAIEVTAKCCWCSWGLFGDVRTTREAFAAHRAAEHPDQSIRERRKRYRPHRQFQSKKDLTDNISAARKQGAAGWAGPE